MEYIPPDPPDNMNLDPGPIMCDPTVQANPLNFIGSINKTVSSNSGPTKGPISSPHQRCKGILNKAMFYHIKDQIMLFMEDGE